jgi:hypothetical protein
MSRNAFALVTMARRLVTGAGLALGICGIAAAECPIDNFDDGDDEGWIHCGEWSEGQEPVWRAGSGQYCLGLRDPVRAPPPPLSIAAEWKPAGRDERYANGCLRVGFRTGTVAAGTWSTHFVVSLRADCRAGGYKAMLGPSLGRISIYRRLGLLADDVDHRFEEGRGYRVEFCAAGADLSLKYWALGDAEPPSPQLRATDELYTKGNIGVGVFIENDNQGPNLEGCYDDVRFVPAGHCAGDLDCDGAVALTDLKKVVAGWGSYEPCHPRRIADLDGNCRVGAADLFAVLKAWGACAAAGRD